MRKEDEISIREEIEAELGYVRSQISLVAKQGPTDTPTEYDTVRFMWTSRAKALEEELAQLPHMGGQLSPHSIVPLKE